MSIYTQRIAPKKEENNYKIILTTKDPNLCKQISIKSINHLVKRLKVRKHFTFCVYLINANHSSVTINKNNKPIITK